MKRHLYIFHLLLLTAGGCFAQKQITHFENSINKQALNPVYQSQLGNKMIFSLFTPASGNELWVSDGTKANTKLLKDIVPGYQSSYTFDFTKAGDFLYFVTNQNEIWKTDGTPAGTQKMLRSDSTLNLNVVAGKLLVTFRDVNTQRFAFAWLGTDGHTDFLNEDATAFRYSEGNLYFGLHDSTSKTWTLKVFDTESRTIASRLGPALNEILVEKHNGYEYIAVDAGYVEKTLIVAPGNRAESAKTYEWNRGPAPVMIRDKTGALFLINDRIYAANNLGLKIFKVIEGHNWETVSDQESSLMYAKTPTGSTEGPFHTNFVIDGDQLTFTTLFGYESIYAAYLGVFDFKKNTKRISPKLPAEVTGRQVQVVPQSRDVFEIRYGYTKCTYDIAENKPVAIEQLPYRVEKVKVAHTEFELSDNVYAGNGVLRLPLVSTRPIYAEKYLAYRTVLNNKLLFWTNNEMQGAGKLCVSDGKTTSELMAYDGLVSSWRMSMDSVRIGNQVVFATTSPQGIRIYKTDGTPSGTREIYSHPTSDWPSPEQVVVNNRLAVFDFMVAGKRLSLVTDLEKVWQIDTERFGLREFRLTSNDVFMIHSTTKNGMGYDMVYQFENGDLKPIELNKAGGDAMNHQIFDNRIYYMLRNSSGQLSDICYNDLGSDQINRLFSGPMSYLLRRGDCLIAGTMSGPDVRIYKASTAELLGAFTGIHPVDATTGKAVGLWSAREAVIVHNDRVISKKFSGDIESVNAIPQGILVQVNGTTGSSWYVYDLKRGKITELFNDETVGFSMSGAGDRLIFAKGVNDQHAIVVDIAKEKRSDFPPGLSVIRLLSEDLALVTDQTYSAPMSVYSTAGDAPVKMYELPGWYDAPGTPVSNYTSFNTASTGFELARFDRDSLYRYREIIKGPEGISLQEVFQFRGSVYAVAFTYSKGIQVWEMDEMNLTPDDDDTLVVVQPEKPGRGDYLPDEALLNAYPNPVVNELNIDLKEGGLIRILDPKGFEQLKTVTDKSKRLDLSKLPAGEYIIIYSGINGRVVKKIVKH